MKNNGFRVEPMTIYNIWVPGKSGRSGFRWVPGSRQIGSKWVPVGSGFRVGTQKVGSRFRVRTQKVGSSGFRVPGRNPESGFQWVPVSSGFRVRTQKLGSGGFRVPTKIFFVPTPDLDNDLQCLRFKRFFWHFLYFLFQSFFFLLMI